MAMKFGSELDAAGITQGGGCPWDDTGDGYAASLVETDETDGTEVAGVARLGSLLEEARGRRTGPHEGPDSLCVILAEARRKGGGR